MFWSPRPAKHISFFVSIGDLLMCVVSVRFFLIKAMSGFEIYIHILKFNVSYNTQISTVSCFLFRQLAMFDMPASVSLFDFDLNIAVRSRL